MSIRQKLMSALAELETLKPDVQCRLAEINRKHSSPVVGWAHPQQNGSSDPYVWPPVKKLVPFVQQYVQVIFCLLGIFAVTTNNTQHIITQSNSFGLENVDPSTEVNLRNNGQKATKFLCYLKVNVAIMSMHI
jgi:hypothetical protein